MQTGDIQHRSPRNWDEPKGRTACISNVYVSETKSSNPIAHSMGSTNHTWNTRQNNAVELTYSVGNEQMTHDLLKHLVINFNFNISFNIYILGY